MGSFFVIVDGFLVWDIVEDVLLNLLVNFEDFSDDYNINLLLLFYDFEMDGLI